MASILVKNEIDKVIEFLKECGFVAEYESPVGDPYHFTINSEEGRALFEYEHCDAIHEVFYGETKIAIVLENVDKVVKIPFDVKTDLCKVEATIYKAAVEAGLENYFVKTEFYGSYEDVMPIYLQDVAYTNEDEFSIRLYNCIKEEMGYRVDEEISCKEEDRIWDSVGDLDDTEKLTYLFCDERMVDFCDKYCINDIHEGNVGYDSGEPVLIDFSGYFGHKKGSPISE